MAQRPPPSRRLPPPAAPDLEPEPDINIGEFVRGKEIGKGSFATVYLASHRKKRSYAAVKAVTAGKLTRKLKDNLESEIRILKSLQHPHIVALFSCTDTPSHIYLVMEYCQLSDLAQFMKKRTQLSELPETADIFSKYPNHPTYGLNEVLVRHFVKQIASAMEYIHVRNLIHRDIKPQNLLLNPSPAYMRRQKPEDVPLAAGEHSLVPAAGVNTLPMLKVADFGFARHLPNQMMAETLCGSPLYMAPEILSYKKYDASADLWSVGAVTYEMAVGKPPFRASNHIELLRKIDQAKDVIPFPKDLSLGSDIKRMIRGLLIRQPESRISYDNFFKSSAVVDPIPGLVGEDIPRPVNSNVRMPDPGVSELSRRMQKQAIDSPIQSRPASDLPPQRDSTALVVGKNMPGTSTATNQGAPRRPSVEMAARKTSLGNASRPVDINRPSGQDDYRRPAMMTHATAPAREYLVGDQLPRRNAPALERQASRAGPAPSTSAPRAVNQADHRRTRNDERERAAQDIAFERDYVMVDRRAVEVNAFADEVAVGTNIPRNTPSFPQHGSLTRRSTTQGSPGSATGAQAATPSQALQTASGRRPDPTLHARHASFERRYAPSTPPVTNLLSKALNAANARLYGILGGSPPIGAGPSPPRGYLAVPLNPFPTAMPTTVNYMDGLDENVKMLYKVREIATRSDTVYSFAEVKYRQLVPATPSAEEGDGIRQIGAVEHPMQASGVENDQDLTQAAVVAVSEEALVLFVKALGVLTSGMTMASIWWRKYTDGEFTPDSSPSRGTGKKADLTEVAKQMNGVVQWARNRFNDCCLKSEIVARRLVEAQKQLPVDHPGHPNNHQSGSETSSDPFNNVGISSENFYLSTGVTAESLMYERAIEMGKSAAVSELVGENLHDCEISYRTAMILFQAIFEDNEEDLVEVGVREKGNTRERPVNGLPGATVGGIMILIEGVDARLKALVNKIEMQKAAQLARAQSERRISVGSTRPTPRMSPSPTMLPGTSPR